MRVRSKHVANHRHVGGGDAHKENKDKKKHVVDMLLINVNKSSVHRH